MAYCPFYIQYEQPRPRPRRFLEQQYGLSPEDLLTILSLPETNGCFRNWRNLQAASRDEGSTIKEEKDKFQVNLDVQHFAPEDISVKTADDCLIVEANHDERQDEHGFVSRKFVRRYPLPEGIDSESVFSKLSSDGVLTITAPLKPPPKGSNERIVPIIQTGPVKKQENKEEES